MRLFAVVLLFIETVRFVNSKTYVSCHNSQDPTLFQNATGEKVVEKVIENIKQCLNVSAHVSLLKRIALVESKFGENGEAMSSNPDGGIWQITPFIYDSLTQIPSTNVFLDQIHKQFNISCLICDYNYSSPIKSGLAAYLFIVETKSSNISESVSDQAKWWVENYNNKSNSSQFVESVSNYEGDCGDGCKVDLWFVLDTSYTISDKDFKSTIDTTISIASSYDVSPSRVQLGCSSVSTKQEVLTDFKQTKTLNNFKTAVSGCPHANKYRQCGSALRQVANVGFKRKLPPKVEPVTESTTSREISPVTVPLDTNISSDEALDSLSDSDGSKKIVFLITNGRSTDDLSSVINDIHESNMTVFAFGVGSEVNQTEIKEYVSKPADVHSGFYSNYSELNMTITMELMESIFCNEENTHCLDIFNCPDPAASTNEPESSSSTSSIPNSWIGLKMCGRDGTPCHFPFIFENKEYNQCTMDGYHKLWCSYGPTYARGEPGFGVCEPCPSRNCDFKASIWFLIDTSWTVDDEDLAYATAFVNSMATKIEYLKLPIKIGFSTFASDHTIYAQFDETTDLTSLQETLTSVNNTKFKKEIGKSLINAFEVGFSESSGARPVDNGTVRIMVVFTDGRSSDNVTEAALQIQSKNVPMMAVAIGDEVDMDNINAIAHDPENKFELGDEQLEVVSRVRRHISMVYEDMASNFIHHPIEDHAVEHSTISESSQDSSTFTIAAINDERTSLGAIQHSPGAVQNESTISISVQDTTKPGDGAVIEGGGVRSFQTDDGSNWYWGLILAIVIVVTSICLYIAYAKKKKKKKINPDEEKGELLPRYDVPSILNEVKYLTEKGKDKAAPITCMKLLEENLLLLDRIEAITDDFDLEESHDVLHDMKQRFDLFEEELHLITESVQDSCATEQNHIELEEKLKLAEEFEYPKEKLQKSYDALENLTKRKEAKKETIPDIEENSMEKEEKVIQDIEENNNKKEEEVIPGLEENNNKDEDEVIPVVEESINIKEEEVIPDVEESNHKEEKEIIPDVEENINIKEEEVIQVVEENNNETASS